MPPITHRIATMLSSFRLEGIFRAVVWVEPVSYAYLLSTRPDLSQPLVIGGLLLLPRPDLWHLELYSYQGQIHVGINVWSTERPLMN